jgi:hypothetical protein
MKVRITESELKTMIEKVLNENRGGNYMFFSNLEQIKRQCELLLEIEPSVIEDLLQNGHDWADDHVSEAKTNMDQVFDFIMGETKNNDIVSEGKENKPTNPKLWKSSLSWAKSRYKVCPSAFCNGAAAKRYKSLGGRWKSSSK